MTFTEEELATEVWKDVPGFERYKVSNLGQLYSKRGWFINPTLDSCGYPQVKLYTTPKIFKSFKVHKVVALAFLPNPDNLPFLNHMDGNKQNARLSNLERCTAQHNTIHAWKLGLCVAFRGENQPNSKLKDHDIPKIRELAASGVSAKDIGAAYGVTGTNIYYILRRATWSHIP